MRDSTTANMSILMMAKGMLTASAIPDAVEAGRWPAGPLGSTYATILPSEKRSAGMKTLKLGCTVRAGRKLGSSLKGALTTGVRCLGIYPNQRVSGTGLVC